MSRARLRQRLRQRVAEESVWASTFPVSAARLAAEYPQCCDACGARVAGLVREEVEGVICERCPTCRQEGAVP